MSKGVGWLVVLLVILSIVFIVLWLQCKRELEECCGATPVSMCSGDNAAFEIEVTNDSFGTFQPFNNQIRGEDLSHRSGFLFQIGDMKDAVHFYQIIELLDSGGGTVDSYGRGELQWIDVECGDTGTSPLPLKLAGVLLPNPAKANTAGYKLHVDLKDPPDYPITALTMWETSAGLCAHTEPFVAISPQPDEGETEHGHVKYFLTSPEACEIRVWKSVDQASPDVTYPAGRVAKLRVRETSEPSKHGGTHSPPWDIGP